MRIKPEYLKENIFDSIGKFTDAFFDGLQRNAVDNMLKQAKIEKRIPMPIITKMSEMSKAARELDSMMRQYER